MNMFSHKSEGKRPLGIGGRRCKENTEMDLTAIGYEGVDCIQLNQGRPQGRVLLNPWFHKGKRNFYHMEEYQLLRTDCALWN
jgi:hypothetical protein